MNLQIHPVKSIQLWLFPCKMFLAFTDKGLITRLHTILNIDTQSVLITEEQKAWSLNLSYSVRWNPSQGLSIIDER